MRKYLIWWNNLSKKFQEDYAMYYYACNNCEKLTDSQIKRIYSYIEEEE